MDIDFVENDRDLYAVMLRAKDDELKLLATIISQKMSSSIDDRCRSPLAITSEIQLMGGNSVVNLFRGHGVGYKEIVLDVAEKIGVDKNILSRTGNSVSSMEMEIIETLFARFQEKLDESDRENLSRKLAGTSKNTRYILLAQALLPHLLKEFDLQGVVELALIIAASRAVVAWVPVVGWLSAGVGTLLEFLHDLLEHQSFFKRRHGLKRSRVEPETRTMGRRNMHRPEIFALAGRGLGILHRLDHRSRILQKSFFGKR